MEKLPMRCCHSWSQMGVDTMESSGGHERRLVETEEKGKFNRFRENGEAGRGRRARPCEEREGTL